MNPLDTFLNSITMYRLLLYGLAILLLVALLGALAGVLPFSAAGLAFSVFLLATVCFGSNWLAARVWRVPAASESSLITALILACVLRPPRNLKEVGGLVLVAMLAMVSKYLLAVRHKHVFNPAALAVVLGSLGGLTRATWWIATPFMLPLVVLLGVLVVRKIRRAQMVSFAIVAALAVLIWLGLGQARPLPEVVGEALGSWPILFFATIMLTEPLTAPVGRRSQWLYAVIVGLLATSRWEIGPFSANPALALLVGNVLAYALNPKQRLRLLLTQKFQPAPRLYEFVFTCTERLRFTAGQYAEWTLPDVPLDGRGNRRFFTMASSPTESEVRLMIKVPEAASSYKRKLLQLVPGDSLQLGQVCGSFVLPADSKLPLVWIAGGVGITPFRSMAQWLIDIQQERDVVLLYNLSEAGEVLYQDCFTAAKKVGLRTTCILRNPVVPSDWKGEVGQLTAELLQAKAPHWRTARYYLSGPNAMVESYKKMLSSLGIPAGHIATDYFPGY